jgi:hypothetical protein
MIVWINGAFGVGKTTTAELLARDTALRLFDPEHVGFLLRAELADQAFEDFQELEPWVRLVPVIADEIARFTGCDLIAVQTVLVEDRWQQLRTGLESRGHQVVHVLLDADEATLRSRIDADPTGAGPRVHGWRHDHVLAYVAARPWMLEAADLVVGTSSRSAEEVAQAVAQHLSSIG